MAGCCANTSSTYDDAQEFEAFEDEVEEEEEEDKLPPITISPSLLQIFTFSSRSPSPTKSNWTERLLDAR
jgi:hypothetical protein